MKAFAAFLVLLCAGSALAGRTIVGQEAAALAQGLAGRQLLGSGDHKYKQGDEVPLWASKVGPFTNPRWGTSSCRDLCSTQGCLQQGHLLLELT